MIAVKIKLTLVSRKIQKSSKSQKSNQSQFRQFAMIKETYKYSELTSKIIGCAMTVHKTLGNGFQEVIYQRALAIEMNLSRI